MRLSPFSGPLQLVKPYVKGVIKAIQQSRKSDELGFSMLDLNRNMKTIIEHIKRSEQQLQKTIDSAPHPITNKMQYDQLLKEWYNKLRPLIKDAQTFLRDYPTIKTDLTQQKTTIDRLLQDLKDSKKKSMFQKALESVRVSEHELLFWNFPEQLQEMDQAKKRLEKTYDSCRGILPEGPY